jgi:hypothetical protein
MEATCTSETLAKPPTTTQYNNPRTQLTSIISYVLQYLQMWYYNFVYVKFWNINKQFQYGKVVFFIWAVPQEFCSGNHRNGISKSP